MLTMDDIDLIIIVVSDTSKDILHPSESKQESMYDRIEENLKGIQHSLYSRHAVPTAPLSVGNIEVGYEHTQLLRIADAMEARIHRVQEEK
jgi:hypothetical protein